jgi:hypothetical protein
MSMFRRWGKNAQRIFYGKWLKLAAKRQAP